MDINNPELIKAFKDYTQDVKDRLDVAFWKAYPEHKPHGGCDEKEVIYFDAVFEAVRVQCTCGETLDIDRSYF